MQTKLFNTAIVFILLLFVSTNLRAASYTWAGGTSSWSTSGSWSSPGIPTTGDNVTINAGGTYTISLTANTTIANLTVSGTYAVLDLGGYTLIVTGTATFTSGIINNGTLNISNGSATTTFGGTKFGANLTVTSGNIIFNGSVFNGTLIADKTGTGTSTGNGGNVFNAAVTLIKSGSGAFTLSNNSSLPDTFNSTLHVIQCTSGNLNIAHQGVGNVFNDEVTFSSRGGGNIHCNYYGTSTFNDAIIIDSLACNLFFGFGSGRCTQTAGHRILAGANGFSAGTAHFRGFTQNGTTDTVNLNVTGTGKMYFEAGSVWNSPIIESIPAVGWTGARFNAPVTFIQTLGSGGSGGGSYFAASAILKNATSGTFSFTVGNAAAQDTFASDAFLELVNYRFYLNGALFLGNTTLKSDVPGLGFHASNNGDVVFRGNVTLIGSGGTFDFGFAAGTTLLDNGAKLILDSPFSGNITLEHFTQVGPDTINFTGTARLALASDNAFDAPFIYSGANFWSNGTTFNNSVNVTRRLASSPNISDGGNVFNGVVTITDSSVSARHLIFANLYPDTFNAAVTFIEKGSISTFIQPAYGANSVFKGNVTVQGTTATPFGANGGKVIFAGGTNQTLNKTGSFGPTFKKVEVNKSAGYLKLNVPVTLTTDSFFLTSGALITDATNILTVPDNGIVITTTAHTGYVHGPMKKSGNDAFEFPLGDTSLHSGAYHPIAISAASSTTDSYTAQYFGTGQTSGDSLASTISYLSHCNYWNLTRNSGTSNVTVQLSWNSESCGVFDLDSLHVAKWDSTLWKDKGNGGITGDLNAGTIVTSSSQNAFGNFTIGHGYPNLSVAGQFGLLAGDSLIAHDTVIVMGKAGATNLITTNVIAIDSLLPNNTGSVSSALADLRNFINYYNRIPGTVLTGNISGDTIEPGIYELNGTLTLDSILIFSQGQSHDSIIVLKINGVLNLAPGHYIHFENTKESNVYWIINGLINFCSDIYFPGNILSSNAIRMNMQNEERSNVLSLSTVELLDDIDSRPNNLFMSHLQLIEHPLHMVCPPLNCPTFNGCNIVTGGDFQTSSSVPTGLGQIEYANCWHKPTDGSTDYFHWPTGGGIVGAPGNLFGTQGDATNPGTPAYGGGYAISALPTNPLGVEYREYGTHPLSSPLISGQPYYLEVKISLADNYNWSIQHFGALFTSTCFQLNPYTSLEGQGMPPTLEFDAALAPNYRASETFDDKTNWMTLKSCFTPTASNWQWLTFGNFREYSNMFLTDLGGGGAYEVSYYYFDDILLLPITVDAGVDQSISYCNNNVQVGVSNCITGIAGFTYSWTLVSGSLPAGISDPTIFNPTITLTNNTSNPINQVYRVTLTSPDGCSVTDDVTITANPSLDLSSVTATSPICVGTTISFSGNTSLFGGTSPYTYTWTGPNGFNSNVLNPSISNATLATDGDYTLTVVDNAGCSNTVVIHVDVDGTCFCVDPTLTTTTVIYDGESSFSRGFVTLSGDVSIEGTFTIDACCPVTFSGATVYMGPNALIWISTGATLTINSSTLKACTDMWDRIQIAAYNSYLTINSSLIQDAEHAVYSHLGGPFSITNSTFDLNYVDIDVNDYNGAIPVVNNSNVYKCSGLLKYPHTTERTHMGIKITDVQSLDVSASSWANKNTFSNMDYGIYSASPTQANSELIIQNNLFTDITAIPCDPGGPQPCLLDQPGIAIYASGNYTSNTYSSKLTVGVDGISANGNTFEKCTQGVVVKDYFETKIEDNHFPNVTAGEYGINIRHSKNFPQNGIVQIVNNNFEDWIRGIHYVVVPGVTQPSLQSSTFKINDNTFLNNLDINNWTIRVLSNFPQGGYVPGLTNEWEIQNNVMAAVTMGINLKGLNPIVKVFNNDIQIKQGGVSYLKMRYGILTEDSRRVKIEQNTITYANTVPDPFVYGISVEASPRTTVHANSIYYMDKGIQCIYAENPVAISCNDIHDCNKGVLINNVINGIGNQGTKTYPHDNQWFGISHNINFTDVEKVGSSPSLPEDWWHRCCGSAVPNPVLFSINQKLALNPTAYNCPNYPPPPCGNPACDAPGIVKFLGIIQAEDALCMADQAGQYMTKQHIYEQLRDNDSIMNTGLDGDAILQNFYDSIAGTNMGLLQQVSEFISDGDLESANAVNESIIPLNLIDTVSFFYNTVYLATYAAGIDTFTEDQMNVLTIIARQCPGICGRAVYDARALLSAMLDTVMLHREDCYLPGEIAGPDTTTLDSFPNAVCPGGTYSFAINSVADAIGYRWFSNIGDADIVFTDTSCTVTFPATIPMNAKVCVVAIDTLGLEGLPQCKFLENAMPVVDTILGLEAFQCGRQGQVYSVVPDGKATGYLWEVSDGEIAQIDGPDDGDSVFVNFISPFDSVQLIVTPSGICGTGEPYALTIYGRPKLPLLADTITACCTDTLYIPFPDSTVTWTYASVQLPYDDPYNYEMQVLAMDSGSWAQSITSVNDFENNINFRVDISTSVEPSYIRVVWCGLNVPTTLTLKAGNACGYDSTTIIINSPITPPDTSYENECCGDTLQYTSEDTTVIAAYAKLLYVQKGEERIDINEYVIAYGEEMYAELSAMVAECEEDQNYINVDVRCNVSPPQIDVVWCGVSNNENLSLAVERGFLTACGLQTQVIVYSDSCNTADSLNCEEARIAQRNELHNYMGSMEVYPNPTNGSVTIKFTSSEETNYSLQVTDLAGQILISNSSKAEKGINYLDMDLARFAKGTYFVRLKSEELNTIKRLIIE